MIGMRAALCARAMDCTSVMDCVKSPVPEHTEQRLHAVHTRNCASCAPRILCHILKKSCHDR